MTNERRSTFFFSPSETYALRDLKLSSDDLSKNYPKISSNTIFLMLFSKLFAPM